METIVENWQVDTTEETEIESNIYHVAPGVWRLKDLFVNVLILQNTKNHEWVLVDSGIESSGNKIKHFIASTIGPNSIPSSIILTHGHFDHRGALQSLLQEWQVPVYAHPLELAYLKGSSSYPPPDPTAGGGLMSFLSFTYPKKPINVSEYLKALPEDGSIPSLKGWEWIHTPGHTPGHISLFRKKDQVLVAGDAFVTTKQESLYHVATQKKRVSGPPKYFTSDWVAAAQSVRELSTLQPSIIVSGHGKALYGIDAKKGLKHLAKHFWEIAIPESGRYVNEPAAFDENGVTYLPPAPTNRTLLAVVGIASCVAVGLLVYKNHRALRKTWLSQLLA